MRLALRIQCSFAHMAPQPLVETPDFRGISPSSQFRNACVTAAERHC